MLEKYLKPLQSANFDKNKRRIDRENRTGVELILLFDTVILLANVLGQFQDPRAFVNNRTLMAQLVYIVLALLVYFFILRKRQTNYTVWIYVIETPLLLITMIGGILSKPDELTFTFMVFLLLFPLLILDKPWHIMVYDIAMALLYGAIASRIKDPTVFERDMVHLINIVLMSFAASLYFLSVRLRNIEYADYFSEKAEEDPLTGLYNRAGARARIEAEKPGIFIYVDLDRFKEVNDQFGHAEGDKVLVEIANALRANFRRGDILIRLGGDEFAVYASGNWQYGQVENKLADLLASIRKIRSTGTHGEPVNMTASIGCAYAPKGAASLEDMIKVADTAMYQAKESGKDKYCIEAM